MRSLQDEIRRVQKELVCPVCRLTFGLRDIKVIFSGPGKAEVSAVCGRGHFPIILVLPISVTDLVDASEISKKELKEISQQISNLDKKILNGKN